jgi:hemoglobin-like flavoprotein
MDERQTRLIRETFAGLRSSEERAGELFYGMLFEQTPGVRKMFQNASMPEQGGKLLQLVAYVVDGLGQWDVLVGRVEELGAQHVGYGVQADHYAAVGTALVTTLRTVLGDAFSAEAEEAWEELYTDLSLVMERGARGEVERNGKELSKR